LPATQSGGANGAAKFPKNNAGDCFGVSLVAIRQMRPLLESATRGAPHRNTGQAMGGSLGAGALQHPRRQKLGVTGHQPQQDDNRKWYTDQPK